MGLDSLTEPSIVGKHRTADKSACYTYKARLRGLLDLRLCLISSIMVGCIVRAGGLCKDSPTLECQGVLD